MTAHVQRARPLDMAYTYDRTGAGVVAYILDTGIRSTHVDLTGRVASGFTAAGGGQRRGLVDGHGVGDLPTPARPHAG
ncbi:hypothetical protein BH23ACT9_BH23ACT9_08200 [soil metagenome]